jgi:2'-5' RNA ligase
LSDRIRSFLAFDIDSQSVLNRLTEAQTLLVKTGADLKIVEAKNIHVTLRFLGDISPSIVEKIYEEMTKVKFVSFVIKIFGLGAFPDVRYPRVVWAGITEGLDALREISVQLEASLRSLGFNPDPKGFSPHLTIARVRSGRNKAELARLIGENSDFEFGIVKANCLRLKRSELTPKGPIYSNLREYCPKQ